VNEHEMIQHSARLLPEIARRLHAGFTGHPLSAGRPISQVRLMALLYRQGRMTVGEAAVGLGVTMPTASEQIDRLVDEGLLVREVNPDDRRQVLVDLTPKAREFGREVHELRLRQITAALDGLEPGARSVFARALEALVEALRLEPDDLPPLPQLLRCPDDTPAVVGLSQDR
jgi:DNA-binding MarR family transcriptional regulator